MGGKITYALDVNGAIVEYPDVLTMHAALGERINDWQAVAVCPPESIPQGASWCSSMPPCSSCIASEKADDILRKISFAALPVTIELPGDDVIPAQTIRAYAILPKTEAELLKDTVAYLREMYVGAFRMGEADDSLRTRTLGTALHIATGARARGETSELFLARLAQETQEALNESNEAIRQSILAAFLDAVRGGDQDQRDHLARALYCLEFKDTPSADSEQYREYSQTLLAGALEQIKNGK